VLLSSVWCQRLWSADLPTWSCLLGPSHVQCCFVEIWYKETNRYLSFIKCGKALKGQQEALDPVLWYPEQWNSLQMKFRKRFLYVLSCVEFITLFGVKISFITSFKKLCHWYQNLASVQYCTILSICKPKYFRITLQFHLQHTFHTDIFLQIVLDDGSG
jgi:hypothetical protein